MASSAMEIRSPAVSSMSSSRPGGSSVIWLARSSSSSVRVAHRGDDDDDVVAVLLRARRSARRHASCARRRRRRNRRTSGRRGPRVHRLPRSPRTDRRLRPWPGAGCDHRMDAPEDWLLSADERGNPHTALPGLDRGQPRRAAGARQHLLRPAGRRGAVAERRATTCSSPTGAAIPTSGCATDGPTVAELFTDAVKRGVCVRGLVWRSHMARLSLNKEANRALDREIEHGGGEVILDQRIRRMGSHHQKFVVLRHDEDPSRDVAFVGGIDLCHSPPGRRRPRRRPAAAADGRGLRAEPAVARRAAADPRPGGRRARHRVPRALGRPEQPRRGPPDRLDPRQAAPHPDARRPAARRSCRRRRSAGRTSCRPCAPIRRSGRRTTSPRTASGRWPAATRRRSRGRAG